MQVSAQYVREHLDDLIDSAEPGDEIEIARDGTPLAKIIVMPKHQCAATELHSGADHNGNPHGSKRIILGAGRGELRVPSDEEWKAMDKELEDLMLNGPLFPDEAR